MKKMNLSFTTMMAGFALLITTVSVNQACMWAIHQPEMPQEAKKLRKF